MKQMSNSLATVHKPQNKQAIIWGAENWDYKANEKQGTLSAGLHGRTKVTKAPKFPATFNGLGRSPGYTFPSDGAFPGFSHLDPFSYVTRLWSISVSDLHFAVLTYRSLRLLRTATKVMVFEMQENSNCKYFMSRLLNFLTSDTMWINYIYI